MTLIIGCITKEYAVLAGDTQLTIGDLQRGKNLSREVEIKVNKYTPNLMFGILGKWSYFIADESGKANYSNEYHNLKNFISKKDNKLEYLQNFIPAREKIEATAIYINQNEDGSFTLDSISNIDDSDLGHIKDDDKELLFNEPFFHTNSKYIKSLIYSFIEKHKIKDTLVDTIFLLNNILLQIISNGKYIQINNNGVTHTGIDNSVGGYVTMCILPKETSHHHNCLYREYYLDYNTLLDKSTYVFSNFADRNDEVRYIDNLAMLVKNSQNDFNDKIVKEALIEVCTKQSKLIVEKDILPAGLMNRLLEHIKQKFSIGIPQFEYVDDLSEVFIEADLQVDFEYLVRFF